MTTALFEVGKTLRLPTLIVSLEIASVLLSFTLCLKPFLFVAVAHSIAVLGIEALVSD